MAGHTFQRTMDSRRSNWDHNSAALFIITYHLSSPLFYAFRRFSLSGSNMVFHALTFASSRVGVESESSGLCFQPLSRDLANVNALKNHVRSLLLVLIENICYISRCFFYLFSFAFSLMRRQHSFVEIDHEIFSTVILSLPLIQEGQLSVSGERMCTILVNRLED